MLKLSKLMGALILAGLVQGAQDAQVVIRGGWLRHRAEKSENREWSLRAGVEFCWGIERSP